MNQVSFQFQRQEYKYLLDWDRYLKMRESLRRLGLRPDSYSNNSNDKNYLVTSIYFDTLDYQAYWEKMWGYQNRTKFRLRSYLAKPGSRTPIFWEIKRKSGDFLKKDRFRLSWEDSQQILVAKSGCDRFVTQAGDRSAAAEFYLALLRKNLQPSILISYLREPWVDYFCPGFRLTFDFNLQAGRSEAGFRVIDPHYVLPNQVIMELKFNGFYPNYLNSLMGYYSLPKSALSKYCLSLEACGIVAEEIV